MSTSTSATVVVGTLVDDPRLRRTSQGAPVTSLTIAPTPSDHEQQDDDQQPVPASIRGQQAVNAAQTLTRGMRVIAHGRLTQDTRTTEMVVDDIGPSLRFTTGLIAPARGPQDPYSTPTATTYREQS